jgi:hypothetical protein
MTGSLPAHVAPTIDIISRHERISVNDHVCRKTQVVSVLPWRGATFVDKSDDFHLSRQVLHCLFDDGLLFNVKGTLRELI